MSYLYIWTESKWASRTSHAIIIQWLKSLPKPCGLMAANDSRARMVLEARRRAHLKVPMDIAVVGVDDDPLMCELSSPPLSNVIQGTDQLGYEASNCFTRCRARPFPVKLFPLAVWYSSVIRHYRHWWPHHFNCSKFYQSECMRWYSSWWRGPQTEISWILKRDSRHLDQTVHERINDFKIKKAKDLLINTQLSINEIAFKAGFNTVQYMSKVIKDNCGKALKRSVSSTRLHKAHWKPRIQ